MILAFPIAYGLATRFKAIENEIKILITFASLPMRLSSLRLGALSRQETARRTTCSRDWGFRRSS